MDATTVPAYAYAPAKTNGLAIASMVLGILGILLFWFFGLGVLLGILAVVFGFIARGQIAREGHGGRGMALAGIITGFVAVGLLVLLFVIGFGLGLSGELD